MLIYQVTNTHDSQDVVMERNWLSSNTSRDY